MKNITIFTKPGCPKCDRLKESLSKDAPVTFVDATTVKGMALASFHEVLKDNFPVMLHDDQKIAGEWISIKRYVEAAGVGFPPVP